MDYRQCLDFLADLGHELPRARFNLETIRTLLAALGHPERAYPTAIVAGTNGKGSTSAMLASVLKTAGYRTGLYTSPHLVRANERIQINGLPIGNEDFAPCFSRVANRVKQLRAEGRLAQSPSFFEYLTATAFVYFAEAHAQFVVLEVGMGGRLDATVITNVELDHQQFLGATHREIAREKAGVIKPHRPVISVCDHPAALEVIRGRCRSLQAELMEIDHAARITGLSQRDGCYRFELSMAGGEPLQVRLRLAGSFQVRNAAAAAAAAQQLAKQGFQISPRDIEEGLERAEWPGRLETLQSSPLIVLDGAHNPAAARELARFVTEHWQGRALRLVYASMRDKAIEEISTILFPFAEEVFVTQCGVDRAATPESILERSPVTPRRVFTNPDPARALETAVGRSAAEDIVLVAGSLFLVGAIKAAIAEGDLASIGIPAPVGIH